MIEIKKLPKSPNLRLFCFWYGIGTFLIEWVNY
jgi:hypothetical protein